MRFVGNIIWFVLGGWYIALLWLIGAALFALSIVGIPLTIAALQMASLSAWPFGREVVHVRELDDKGLTATTTVTGTIGFVVNVIWACTFGIVLFLAYLFAGILCCLTLIGIPFGLQAFKLAGLSFWPVGRRVVTTEVANLARDENAKAKLAKYRGATPSNTHHVIPAQAGSMSAGAHPASGQLGA